jgi:hypothetical protein
MKDEGQPHTPRSPRRILEWGFLPFAFSDYPSAFMLFLVFILRHTYRRSNLGERPIQS